MTVGPGRVRLQVTVPQEMKAHLDQVGAAAGLSASDVAAIYLAEGRARTMVETEVHEGTK